jgi:SAM-dependent methyltransferase
MVEHDAASLECPVCGKKDASVLFESSNGYPIVRCSACGLAYTDARTAPPASTLYPEFDQSESAVPRLLRRWLSVFMVQREGIVRDVVPKGRLLDFGCGSGSFARWMARAGGYDVVGLEPFSLRQPIESEHLRLIGEPLDSAAPDLGRFDVITMWHVLEHLPNPTAVLRTLSELLAPGGTVIVSVPNLESWQSIAFRGSWFHLDPPRHLCHFDRASLERCLGDANLEPFHSWSFVPEYGASGWVQSALNGLLPHSNYLYEVVKDRGALHGMGVASHLVHLTTSMALGLPAVVGTTPVEAVASAFHGGAALTVAARKRPGVETR